jgi:hypothetical protein
VKYNQEVEYMNTNCIWKYELALSLTQSCVLSKCIEDSVYVVAYST